MPKCLKIFFANLLGGQIIIGPFLISIGGKGIALTIFLLFIIFFNLIKLIVDIRLIIFLCFGKESLCKILFPTFGVIPKKITEDLSIIFWLFFITWRYINSLNF